MATGKEGTPASPTLEELATTFGEIGPQRQEPLLKLASHKAEIDAIRKEYQCTVQFAERIRQKLDIAAAQSSVAAAEPSRTMIFSCPFVCGAGFKDMDALKGHMRTSHCLYECSTCDKSFERLSDYVSHHDSHQSCRGTACSSPTSCKRFVEWGDKEHHYAFGCGICGALFIRNSKDYVSHVLHHYQQGKTAWQPTLHLRALLKEDNTKKHWDALLSGILADRPTKTAKLLKWDQATCEEFDKYLQRNALELMPQQLPRLLAAGLKYVEAEDTQYPQQNPPAAKKRK